MDSNRLKYKVYLGLGSNLGDKKGNIELAIQKLQLRVGEVVKVSSMYVTKPLGFDSDNTFVNAACLVYTCLSPIEVLEATQIIEKELGRDQKSANGIHKDRTMDIDILLYDNRIVEYPHLVIPHPHMHERDFVLSPLSEIAPDTMHPILKQTILDIRDRLSAQ